ncbi:hypothetical protein [Rossellomorea sp. RS05]|uniref:hypothetical protein n=1 Tax=Rossellomorea sp. RS05 TaxID=3149166 RepID=UPI0032213D5A
MKQVDHHIYTDFHEHKLLILSIHFLPSVAISCSPCYNQCILSKGVMRLKEAIISIVEVINNFHDVVIEVTDGLGLNLTDKDLHFWVMGIIGMLVFFFVYAVSKVAAKMPFGIAGLSFMYTLTFMFVLVFAIEIQQAITQRGNMEFADAIIGLWGFLAFFLIYAAIIGIFLVVRSFFKKPPKKKRSPGRTTRSSH